ncbi:MAG: hypothetical protein J0H77_21170 [Alphaproteobacteria bacterium]|jgi:nitrogen fixation protein FixH|nr:hypothetical protein [Alphaproteobacteria bacterium]
MGLAALTGVLSTGVPWTGQAVAQHSHGSTKGPNGGKVQDVAGVHVELVVAGNAVTINVLDENNKPISAEGYTGSMLIASGGTRQTVQLVPSGTGLKGEAKPPVPADATYTLVIKTAAGKSGQVKF